MCREGSFPSSSCSECFIKCGFYIPYTTVSLKKYPEKLFSCLQSNSQYNKDLAFLWLLSRRDGPLNVRTASKFRKNRVLSEKTTTKAKHSQRNLNKFNAAVPFTNPRRNKSQIYLPYFDPNYSDKR